MKGHSTSFWYGKKSGRDDFTEEKSLFFETLSPKGLFVKGGHFRGCKVGALSWHSENCKALRNLLPSAPTIDMAPWLLSKYQARTWGFNMDNVITKALNMKNTLKHIEATRSFNSFIPGNHLRKTVFFPIALVDAVERHVISTIGWNTSPTMSCSPSLLHVFHHVYHVKIQPRSIANQCFEHSTN